MVLLVFDDVADCAAIRASFQFATDLLSNERVGRHLYVQGLLAAPSASWANTNAACESTRLL